ncbi:MAG: box helicase domain protein [Chthoniobacteraceae bacterium]|nr:box helicase domain protein [Chthoniobacteraceae bacterium]
MIGIDALLHQLVIPDFWQQGAVHALRQGKDVVVHAPTGAGKTYIFELLYPNLRGQAVFTVPTRALANDKLAEWRARGWDVGIATGDLALNLHAKVIVATLETQKGKFIQRAGPRLLVVDEYQMIGDAVRGVNYELALALAPAHTQLLLLSGSVANPQAVVDWLRRIGRDAVLISHAERPVPLEEIDLLALPNRAASHVRGWWPRLITNALRAELGPILMFAPRRNAAEELAQQLASALPPDQPLTLTPEQQSIAGPRLGKLLSARVAYHHSGLSYAQRAGLIEPLAKNGQLRVVVATMGLAAGINFSMRSVVVTATTYKAGFFEQQIQPDELLQMFGRAGRRGLDETGYALITDKPPRLMDARARQLRRANPVDWPTLIAVMQGACASNVEPFSAALELNRRLFTPVEIPLGVEHCRLTGPMPCNLSVDMERARFARRNVVEILNSRGEWEPRAGESKEVRLGDAWILDHGRWRPALSIAHTLHPFRFGVLCKLEVGEKKRYGRELHIGTRRGEGTLALAPWLRKLLKLSRVDKAALEADIIPRLATLYKAAALIHEPESLVAPAAPIIQNPRLAAIIPRGEQLFARFNFDDNPIRAWVDSHGMALVEPPERRELPIPCQGCPELPWCSSVEIVLSPAFAWRRLGLIEPDGHPTRRGILFSFFHHGEGLAVAAALEDERYPMDELVFDLANLRAGPRFSGDDSPYGGRLGGLCQQTYRRADLPGYLEMGVPADYGAGASEIVREMVEHQTPRQKMLTESLRQGDLERALIEWRSLLRHIIWAPDYDWSRWRDLKEAAARYVEATHSPGLEELPPLTNAQRSTTRSR